MSKQQKGNRETKKPKAATDGTKKQKKDPKIYNGSITDVFGNPKKGSTAL